MGNLHSQIYSSLHDRLKNQHLCLQEIVSGTSTERKRLHPAPGKWSIHDILTHLAKYQPVYLDRMKKILTETIPEFGPYLAENDSEFEEWRARKGGELLETLKRDREIIFNFITNLTTEQLSRKGRHKKFGELTIVQWTEFFVLHEAYHIFTVFKLANDVELKSI